MVVLVVAESGGVVRLAMSHDVAAVPDMPYDDESGRSRWEIRKAQRIKGDEPPEIVTWSRIISRHSEILNVKLVHVAGDQNPIRPPQSLCWKSRYLASDSV